MTLKGEGYSIGPVFKLCAPAAQWLLWLIGSRCACAGGWRATQWVGRYHYQPSAHETWISPGWNIRTNNETLRWRNVPSLIKLWMWRRRSDATAQPENFRLLFLPDRSDKVFCLWYTLISHVWMESGCRGFWVLQYLETLKTYPTSSSQNFLLHFPSLSFSFKMMWDNNWLLLSWHLLLYQQPIRQAPGWCQGFRLMVTKKKHFAVIVQ